MPAIGLEVVDLAGAVCITYGRLLLMADGRRREVETAGAVAPAFVHNVAAGSSALAAAAALGLPALAGMVAGTTDGIAIVDADRRYVYANPAACHMLGSPLERLRGRDFLMSFPERERVSLHARLT